MHIPRDGRSRVLLSDRKVLFHRGFRGDETGVSGDDGHFFFFFFFLFYVFSGKISRERKVSHAAEDSTHTGERERERIPRKSVDGSIPRERERENREKLEEEEEEEEEGKEREKNSAHLNCRVCVLKQ